MQIKNVIFAASLAATATALPAVESKPFNVIAIHSGSGVQYAAFNAAKSSIFAGLPSQNASCARPEEQAATFYLNNGALYLYDQSATPQELFVDRSGMGQGKIGYTTGAQPAPRNAEREGWAVQDGHLQFGGNDLIACPNSIDNSWSIWASAGVSNPGGNSDCVGIAARVEETSNPNGCLYTE
ncbi:Cell wall protein phiA [Penicillium rolfsii]|nr:Cell wall protein phiA [Penicillium rolfsii]